MKTFLLFDLTLLVGLLISFVYFKEKTPPSTISFTVPTPTQIPFDFFPANPPKDSLIGEISSPSGEILWQSRTSTGAATLGQVTQIKQGEKLVTKNNSQVTINFSPGIIIQEFSASDIEFIQTLTQNVVINQLSGRVSYNQTGTIPLSIRTLHLLVNVASPDLVITTNSENDLVYLDIYAGSVTLGYNNPDFQTITQTIPSGKRVVFHDLTRTLVYKKIPPKD
jgi:hypothetical protein